MSTPRPLLCKVVSGGQNWVDIAALDWAITQGIPHGGRCPKGRRAEGGRIPDRCQLRETATSDFQIRIRLNVEESDATVIFTAGSQSSGGTLLTFRLAQARGEPVLHLHEGARLPELRLLAFLTERGIGTLDVAGPRASRSPPVGHLLCERPRPDA